MSDLRARLAEALDDAERLALACQAEVGTTRKGEMYADGSGVAEHDDFPSYPWGIGTDELAFTTEWNPATVLRLVAYGRKVLARHERDDDGSCVRCWTERDDAPWPCLDVLDLAAFWLDTQEADRG